MLPNFLYRSLIMIRPSYDQQSWVVCSLVNDRATYSSLGSCFGKILGNVHIRVFISVEFLSFDECCFRLIVFKLDADLSRIVLDYQRDSRPYTVYSVDVV